METQEINIVNQVYHLISTDQINIVKVNQTQIALTYLHQTHPKVWY